jgi:hypothetical protein
VGSGRQAAQGKKGYKDQRLPKTGKPSRRTSIEPEARCNRPWCLVLSWIATYCCAVRVHSSTPSLLQQFSTGWPAGVSSCTQSQCCMKD